jgi:hypothetical protein
MNNNFNSLYESGGCISFRSHRRYFWQHRRSGGNVFKKKIGPNLQQNGPLWAFRAPFVGRG